MFAEPANIEIIVARVGPRSPHPRPARMPDLKYIIDETLVISHLIILLEE